MALEGWIQQPSFSHSVAATLKELVVCPSTLSVVWQTKCKFDSTTPLSILHSHVYLFCTWAQPSIKSSAEPTAAPLPGVLQSLIGGSSPGNDKMMTKYAKMYIQYVWKEWVPDTYSATLPRYETLPSAVATDPVVLLILHTAACIPHTCPLATGMNRHSRINPAAFICNMPLNPHFLEIGLLELRNYARVGI